MGEGLRDMRGVFITFEGGDGTGKTTHIGFLAEALEARGYEVVRLREPGGTSVGEALRAVVLDPAHESLDDKAELLIYEAARAQIVSEVITPALRRGAVVLCDRFFDSTVAYQAFGRGLDRAFVDAANRFATGGVVPDRTILMTCGSSECGLARANARASADRLELAGSEFHARVEAGFLALAQQEPDRVRVVRSDGARSLTAALVFQELGDLFPWMRDAGICSEEFFARLDEPRAVARAHGMSDARNASGAYGMSDAPEAKGRAQGGPHEVKHA